MTPGSIFRGQSRTGIGEGGGVLVLHGDQYLAADEPYSSNKALLAAIRPWVSFDAQTEDHLELKSKLEGWSYFGYQNYRLVTRMSDAGMYDHRHAYFSHTQVWSAADFDYADPGAHLGRSEVFDQPWRDTSRPGSPAIGLPETIVRYEQVIAEAAVAEALLAHFYQALIEQRPMVLAVPSEDFASGSALHALVSFARAALPGGLKRDCRIRVYTGAPHRFLTGDLAVNLLVIPDRLASDAVHARRDALLVKRDGTASSGAVPGADYLGYAKAILKRLANAELVRGLLPFTSRFSGFAGERPVPGEKLVRMVPLIFNIAAAFSHNDERHQSELLQYLLSSATQKHPELEWDHLLTERDWQNFSAEAIEQTFKAPSPPLQTPSLQALLRNLAGQLRARKRSLDEYVVAWSVADRDDAQLGKLSEYMRYRLVEPDNIARLTTATPTERLAALPDPSGIIEAEAASRSLSKRRDDAEALAALALHPPTLSALASATDQGLLDDGWAMALLQRRGLDLANVCELLFPLAVRGGRWSRCWQKLFQRLRTEKVAEAALEMSIRQLAPAQAINKIFLEVLELSARYALPSFKALQNRFLSLLKTLPDELQDEVVQLAFDPDWSSINAIDLDDDGELRGDWLWKFADRLFSEPSLVAVLKTHTLAIAVHQGLISPAVQYFCAREIDRRMDREPGPTIGVLIEFNLWTWWRPASQLPNHRELALGWLGHERWSQSPSPRVFIDSWNWVMADVDKIDPALMSRLERRGGGASFPWIAPFEDRQIADLAMRSEGLGALLELSVHVAQRFGGDMEKAASLVLGAINRQDLLRAALWVIPGIARTSDWKMPPAEDMEILARGVGPTHQKTMERLLRRFVWEVMFDPRASDLARGIAYGLAGKHQLLSDEAFRGDVASAIAANKVSFAYTNEGRHLDQHLRGTSVLPLVPAQSDIARAANRNKLYELAKFLGGGDDQFGREDPRYGEAVQLLLDGSCAHEIWRSLAARPGPWAHAMRGLRETLIDDDERLNKLRELPWKKYFAELLLNYSQFFGPPVTPPYDLPALQLMVLIMPTANRVSGAASELICIGLQKKDLRDYLEGDAWWEALENTIEHCRRPGGILDPRDEFEWVLTRIACAAEDRTGKFETVEKWQGKIITKKTRDLLKRRKRNLEASKLRPRLPNGGR